MPLDKDSKIKVNTTRMHISFFLSFVSSKHFAANKTTYMQTTNTVSSTLLYFICYFRCWWLLIWSHLVSLHPCPLKNKEFLWLTVNVDFFLYFLLDSTEEIVDSLHLHKPWASSTPSCPCQQLLVEMMNSKLALKNCSDKVDCRLLYNGNLL